MTENHYRIVYISKDGDRHVSLTRSTFNAASSLADLCNYHARHGRFTVEDEHAGSGLAAA